MDQEQTHTQNVTDETQTNPLDEKETKVDLHYKGYRFRKHVADDLDDFNQIQEQNMMYQNLTHMIDNLGLDYRLGAFYQHQQEQVLDRASLDGKEQQDQAQGLRDEMQHNLRQVRNEMVRTYVILKHPEYEDLSDEQCEQRIQQETEKDCQQCAAWAKNPGQHADLSDDLKSLAALWLPSENGDPQKTVQQCEQMLIDQVPRFVTQTDNPAHLCEHASLLNFKNYNLAADQNHEAWLDDDFAIAESFQEIAHRTWKTFMPNDEQVADECGVSERAWKHFRQHYVQTAAQNAGYSNMDVSQHAINVEDQDLRQAQFHGDKLKFKQYNQIAKQLYDVQLRQTVGAYQRIGLGSKVRNYRDLKHFFEVSPQHSSIDKLTHDPKFRHDFMQMSSKERYQLIQKRKKAVTQDYQKEGGKLEEKVKQENQEYLRQLTGIYDQNGNRLSESSSWKQLFQQALRNQLQSLESTPRELLERYQLHKIRQTYGMTAGAKLGRTIDSTAGALMMIRDLSQKEQHYQNMKQKLQDPKQSEIDKLPPYERAMMNKMMQFSQNYQQMNIRTKMNDHHTGFTVFNQVPHPHAQTPKHKPDFTDDHGPEL